MPTPRNYSPQTFLQGYLIQHPDPEVDVQAWEQSWERLFTVFYDPAFLARDITQLFPGDLLDGYSRFARPRTAHETAVRELCRFQMDIFPKIAIAFAGFDLEQKWNSLSQSKREELVLEGVRRTAVISLYSAGRLTCPDSTRARLTSSGGTGFIAMLKSFLLEKLDAQIVDPILFPGNPQVDDLIARLRHAGSSNIEYQVFARTMELERAWCWSHILWNILAAHVSTICTVYHNSPSL